MISFKKSIYQQVLGKVFYYRKSNATLEKEKVESKLSQENNKKSDKKSKTSWIKDVIEIVFFIAIAVAIVLSFNSILGLALHTDTPLVVVTSESMEPSYWGSNRADHGGTNDIRKDMLIVRGVDPSEIRTGDVIVFKYVNHTENDIPIVHRVNRVYLNESTGDYWFTTKGDNPSSNDVFLEGYRIEETTIHESRVVGKIVGRIPYLGGIYKYFQESQGRTILLIIVGVVFVASIVFSMTGGDDEKEEVFDDKEVFDENKDTSKKEEKEIKAESFWEKIKKGYRKIEKRKHYVIPGLILFIIILVPIVDTLDANWNGYFGVESATYDRTFFYEVEGGRSWFVYVDVTVSNPGHWHQEFNSLTIEISNKTTSEILGEADWYLLYNFEGSKALNLGAWVTDGLLIDSLNYTITLTAHLGSKFGRTWEDTKTVDFTFHSPFS
ncbi:MAG: signal peptidase I [Candidatus Heimdallarchaeota archaeon]|nr:signal peptidase I [Candidatus Heimdallarchaeota archaeon]